MSARESLHPAAILEAYGLTCGRLEPLIAQHLRALAPGDVLEIRSDMAVARDGIGAWVWLTGHALVAIENEAPAPRARYYVRKKASARGERHGNDDHE